MRHGARVEITYCIKCKWLLRTSWIAQELLSSLGEEISEVALVPGTGGIFEISVGGEMIWSLKEKKRFPEIKELKRLIRDVVAPGKDLGHTDR